jgi:acetoin utilization deacetylase AcuC-like enzyme
MLILHDPTTLLHTTVELLGARLIAALECPERILSILDALESSNHQIQVVEIQHGTDDTRDQSLLQKLLSATHERGYLQHLRTAYSQWRSDGVLEKDGTVLPECFPNQRLLSATQLEPKLTVPPKDIFARAGYYAFDMSAGISEHTWKSALASANLAVEGSRIIMQNDDKNSHNAVLALCRPPGHHCTTSMAGGYCYINNAVIAVEAIRHYCFDKATSPPVPKIVILDIDFHHGNGTQDYFYDDPNVLYISIHGDEEYPYYSGREDEKGQGAGKGFNVNLPLAAGSSFEQYMEKVRLAVRHIEDFEPQYSIISLGFDTFHLDRLGSFKLYTESYEAVARQFRSSRALQDIPSLILLEGGYVVESLGHNVVSFLKGWDGITNIPTRIL